MLLIKHVTLGSQHTPTGNTRHWIGGEQMPLPASLEISQYPGDTAFYLRYLDAVGREMTDSWHQSLEDVMHQAEFEFGVKSTEWQSPGGV